MRITKANKKDWNGMSALHIVCSNGNIKYFSILMYHPNIDINVGTDEDNITSMHYLCDEPFSYKKMMMLRIMSMLPEILVNKCTKYGDTPLHWAAFNCRYDIVKLLSNVTDIDIGIINSDGLAAVDEAKNKQNEKIVNFLSKIN